MQYRGGLGIAASAIPANSPVIRRTAAWAFPVLLHRAAAAWPRSSGPVVPPSAADPAPGCGRRRRRLGSAQRCAPACRSPWPADRNRSDRPQRPPPRWCRRGPCRCAAASPRPPWPAAPRSTRHRIVTAPGGDLHQRRRVRHPRTQGIRQNPATRSSRTPPDTATLTQPIAELQEHQPQVGLHRDRRAAEPSIEDAANGAKNTGSSSSASTRSNSTGNTNSSSGSTESHNVGWSFIVLSTMASIPSSPRVRGHPPCVKHHPTGYPRPDFFRSK